MKVLILAVSFAVLSAFCVTGLNCSNNTDVNIAGAYEPPPSPPSPDPPPPPPPDPTKNS